MLRPLFEVRRYRGDVETHSHSHSFHQVVLPMQGRLRMVVSGIEGCVSSEYVALIAAGESHSFAGSAGNVFLVIDIPTQSPANANATGAVLWQRVRHQPFLPVDANLLHFIDYLASATESGLLRGSLVDHACALLLGTVSSQLGIGEHEALPPGLGALLGYLDTHLEWPITVADMARVASVSPSRLHTWFRDRLGATPQKFLAQKRLRRASELLAHTSLSVVEVALRVGYGDQAAFSRAFRRHMHTTPLSYRAVMLAPQDEHKTQ